MAKQGSTRKGKKFEEDPTLPQQESRLMSSESITDVVQMVATGHNEKGAIEIFPSPAPGGAITPLFLPFFGHTIFCSL